MLVGVCLLLAQMSEQAGRARTAVPAESSLARVMCKLLRAK